MTVVGIRKGWLWGGVGFVVEKKNLSYRLKRCHFDGVKKKKINKKVESFD